jgi:hypothetical protein
LLIWSIVMPAMGLPFFGLSWSERRSWLPAHRPGVRREDALGLLLRCRPYFWRGTQDVFSRVTTTSTAVGDDRANYVAHDVL